MAEVVAWHTNSEGEEITIERVTEGPFQGQLLLVIHDDPPLSRTAPMLLDTGTMSWLLKWVGGAHAVEHLNASAEREGGDRG